VIHVYTTYGEHGAPPAVQDKIEEAGRSYTMKTIKHLGAARGAFLASRNPMARP